MLARCGVASRWCCGKGEWVLVVGPRCREYPCLLSLRTGLWSGNLGLTVQLQAKMGSGLTNYQDLLLLVVPLTTLLLVHRL